MSRELTLEVTVGWFMMMVLIGLAYFTIILSRESWFRKKSMLEVKFTNVMGLREGDGVTVRGMPVGKVKEMTLTNGAVRVALSLDRPVDVREDCRIAVVATSILGGRAVSIEEGSRTARRVPEGTIVDGVEPNDLIEDAAKLVASLKKGFEDGRIVDDLKTAVGELKEVAVRVNAGKGTLGRLLADDDTMYRDLSAAVASLRTISERLEKGEGTLGRLLSKEDHLHQDLSAAVSSLRVLGARLEKGEGTLGRLMTDDGLYTDLEQTVKEVRATVDDFREAAPVTTFTSVFFGAF